MQDAKRRAIIFTVISIALATLAGILFLQKVSAVDAKLGELATVYVAKKNILSRQPLRKEDFEVKEVPVQFLSKNVVTDFSIIEKENLVSVVPLQEGDLLSSNTLKRAHELTSGDKRMVLIPQSQKIQFDDRFSEQDRVDIVVSYEKVEGKQPVTEYLLTDVPVVATAKDVIGVELSKEDARKLIHMENFAVSIRVLKAPQEANKSSDEGKGSTNKNSNSVKTSKTTTSNASNKNND
ncbi:SAF domain-containing protein [Lihuaxuella thermophila]|uniref:Pilus assembly protein CpaB n=1 Tax=Lihuaxuella thermophila TaxID=1173111 RepID=A0A1H8I558_9BACL|nr:SAF domain-containing protein [Lihuaxuella thermophila]SEN63265.1 pilus assembly protein CpaB [Lihuaxuella thermophila]